MGITVIPVVDEGLGNSSYLVDLADGRALAVDASRDLRALQAAAERRNRFWRIVGITLAVVLTIAGLAVVATVVLFIVAINSWGSNK